MWGLAGVESRLADDFGGDLAAPGSLAAAIAVAIPGTRAERRGRLPPAHAVGVRLMQLCDRSKIQEGRWAHDSELRWADERHFG